MSFRKEIKLRLNKSKIYNFKDLLSSRGAEILYPKRIVSSLYFDTNNKIIFGKPKIGITTKLCNNRCW